MRSHGPSAALKARAVTGLSIVVKDNAQRVASQPAITSTGADAPASAKWRVRSTSALTSWSVVPLLLSNMVYRAYRYPYDWVPQLALPDEQPIARLDKTTFRVPGAAPMGRSRVTEVEGAQG